MSNYDGYYTGKYTASSSFKWKQADQARSQTIAKVIKEGYIANNAYEIKSYTSWTSNDMNDYNRSLIKSSCEYQRHAMSEITRKYGNNYTFKARQLNC